MVVDVVLRKTGKKDPSKEYALMVREYSGIEVEWITLCYMDSYSASQLDGETISYWDDSNDDESSECRALRLEHPSLREAWENYQVLKQLCSKK